MPKRRQSSSSYCSYCSDLDVNIHAGAGVNGMDYLAGAHHNRISGLQPMGRCGQLVAHSMVVAALAAGDLFQKREQDGEGNMVLGAVLAVLYLASAILPLTAELFNHHESGPLRFPWLLVTLLHTGISTISASWRYGLAVGGNCDPSTRAAYMLGIFQLETMLLHPVSNVAASLTSSISLVALLALMFAKSVRVVDIIETSLVVLAIGAVCATAGPGCYRCSASKIRSELLEGVWAASHSDDVSLVDSSSVFSHIFRHILNNTGSLDVEPMLVKQQPHVETRLEHLVMQISASKQSVENCGMLTPDLRITLINVLYKILQELRSTSSLQAVTAMGLQGCSPMMLDFVNTALNQDSAATDRLQRVQSQESSFSAQESKSDDSEHVAQVLPMVYMEENPATFDDAVRVLVSCLTAPQGKGGDRPPPEPPGDAVRALRKQLGSWHFDALHFSRASSCDCPLGLIGAAALMPHIEALNLSMDSLYVFLTSIEGRYSVSNAYHTSLHAADVMNSMLHFITCRAHDTFDPFEKLTGLVAAIAHDVGHSGKANIFHSVVQTPVSLLFNDQSIQENMHCAILFAVLRVKALNFLDGVGPALQMKFRSFTIQMILDTDLARHVQVVSSFRQQLLDAGSSAASAGTGGFGERLETGQRKQLLSFILKCSDLGHSAKQFDVHAQWTMRITDEFYRQGDTERALGLTCSPFCDRRAENICESQQGFFNFLASPLLKTMNEYLQSQRIQFEVISTLNDNAEFWKVFNGEEFNYDNPMESGEILKLANMQQVVCTKKSAGSPKTTLHSSTSRPAFHSDGHFPRRFPAV